MGAKKLTEPKALVISRDGDITDEIKDFLIAQGFQPIPAGTGNEGVEALAHYQPKAVVLYFQRNEQDIIVLRAIQDLCRTTNCTVAIISPNVQVVQRMLGVAAKSGFCRVFADTTALFEEQRPRVAAEVYTN